MTYILPIVYSEVYVKKDVAITTKKKVCFLISNCSLLAHYALATLHYLVMNVTFVSFHRDGLCQENSPKQEDN